MSDNILRFTSNDPGFVPEQPALAAAALLLGATYPDADAVSQRTFGSTALIDCGSNLESTNCGACGTELDKATAQRAIEAGVERETIALSCCSRSFPATRLRFNWPMAFATFTIDVRNPGLDMFHPERHPTDDERRLLEQLTEIIGTDVRPIWAHY